MGYSPRGCKESDTTERLCFLWSECWSLGGTGLRFSDAWGHCGSVRHTEETMTFTVLYGYAAGQINLCDLRTICFLRVGEISLRNHLGAFLGGTWGILGVAFLWQFSYYNSRMIISLFRFSMSPRFSFYKLYFFRTVSLYFIHAFKCICRELSQLFPYGTYNFPCFCSFPFYNFLFWVVIFSPCFLIFS